MKYYFSPPELGRCTVKLWAIGKYGFSAPKRVEITTPEGSKSFYSYRTLNEAFGLEVKGRIIVRIAIAHFLAHPLQTGQVVELDSNMPMFDGRLICSRFATG